jgi:4-amino-4-deoxy-L-arabinose transferase-like glycosyltransferase
MGAGAMRGSSKTRWLWWTIAACCIIVVFAPVIITARPAPVLAVALVSSAVAGIVGIGAAVARIVWTHGRPLGDRDPMLDGGSPYLRPGNRLRLSFAMD